MRYPTLVRDGCLLGAVCAWSNANRKHFPFSGMTKEHTRRHAPARYLAHFDEGSIRRLETETVQLPGEGADTPPARTRYLRGLGEVIGWDDGEDAKLSYVECSGGSATRAYHGRPMHEGNPRAGGWEHDR